MGINLRDALSGLGQGMQVFGKMYGNAEQAEEDRKLEREKMASADAIEEKRFAAARADAKIRNEQLRVQTMVNRMTLNSKTMAANGIAMKMEPEALVPTLNNNANTGYAFRYNAAASDVVTQQSLNGEKGYAMDIGVFQKDAEGNFLVGDDGKKIFQPVEGEGKIQTWQNKTDFAAWYAKLNNPADTWARYNQEATNEQILEQHRAMKKVEDESEGGQATIGLQNARATALKDPKTNKSPQASSFTGPGGKSRPQSSQDVEKAKTFTNELNKSGEFDEKFSPDDGARIMALKNSTSQMAVVEGYFSTLTEPEFMDKMKTTKIPKEFLKKMYAEGSAVDESPNEKPNFFEYWWNKFTD